MDIYFLTLLLLVINRLIVDTQTQVLGILFFNYQEQYIQIWMRPQTWFMFVNDDYFQRTIPIAIINNKDGQIILRISIYQNSFDNKIILFLETKQISYQFYQYEFKGALDVSWFQLQIYKSTEKILQMQLGSQEFGIDMDDFNLYQPNMIYSYQSLLFTCQIFDEPNMYLMKEQQQVLVLENDVFIKKQMLRIFNFRSLTSFQIYIKYQQTLEDYPLIEIGDEDGKISILLNQTNIIIDFNYSYYKSFSQAFDLNMINQWIQITLLNELDQMLCYLAFKDKVFEQRFFYVEQQSEASDNYKFILPQILHVFEYLQNYRIFVINKLIYTETKVSLEEFCFQNCKICNGIECLQCEGKLSLETNCLCPINQHFHQSFGLCVDKTLTQNININNAIDLIFCAFGQYYDQETLKCRECPKLNEYYCTSCLYNSEHFYNQWKPINKKYCEFQDIYQQIYISELDFQYRKAQITPSTFPNKIGKFLFKQHYTEYDEQRYIIESRDIYRIQLQLCEQNFFYNQNRQQCQILSKGQQYDYQDFETKLKICKVGYAYLKNCIKCQNNCLFCKFINNKLICLLPKQSYTISQNLKILKCQDKLCQKIENQTFDECQIDNCMVCFLWACLICNHQYVQDNNNICHLGSKYSDYLKIEINENLIKPQFDFQQILYLRYQLVKFQIDIQSNDIMQLILFSNNLKVIRRNISQSYNIFNNKINQPQSQQSQNVWNNKDNQQIYCLNQTQYYGKRFCHQPVPGYQFSQQLDRYVYCDNNSNCQFDLIYQVTVLFTNHPSIIYKNMTFFDFGHFTRSLLFDELHIWNIIIEAVVYVFDSLLVDCNYDFFFMTHETNYYYQIILDFKGVSVFPCQKLLTIFFHEVTLVNLFTYSSIQLEFQTNKLLMKNCTFLKQENIYFNIGASDIELEQIYIQGILKKQVQHIINIENPVEPYIIENILINNLYIGNVSLFSLNIITIYSKVNYMQMEFIKLQDNKFEQQSSFLRSFEAIYVNIEFLIIDNMIFQQSGLILLEMIPPNQVAIYNLVIQKSNMKRGGILIKVYDLILFYTSFIDGLIDNCGLFEVFENLTIQNIIFKEITFFGTQILFNRFSSLSIIQFSIIQSTIINDQSLIQIQTQNFSLRQIYVKNCNYAPNINLINIIGEVGIISSLMISNVTNSTAQVKEYFASYHQIEEIIIIQADQIVIQWFYIVESRNPQSILNIKYKQLQINRLYLREIYFLPQQSGKVNIIKQLIQINSIQKETGICFIQNFKASQIFIEVYSNYFMDKSNNLILLSTFGGQLNIKQLTMDNILSKIQIYIVKADQLQMRMQNINLNNMQNVGLMYFSSSQVNMIQVYYYTTYLYQIIVPLLKNDDLKSINNIITLEDIQLHNLSTSLIEIISNSSLEIRIINLNAEKIILQNDFIRIEQINPILGLLFFKQIYISDQLSDNQQQIYFLNGINLDIKIHLFQIKNSSMGIQQSINKGQFCAKGFFIENATSNHELFQFSNYSGDIILQQIMIKNLTQQDNRIIQIDFSNQSMNLEPNIIFDNILINQYKGNSFIKYVQSKKEKASIRLLNIRIEQSQFRNSVFQLDRINFIKLDIQGLQIYKVDCGLFFLSPIKNILIKKSVIIDLYLKEIQGTQEIQFISSYLYQTNIENREIDANISYPIKLSFHKHQSFNSLKKDKTYQIQYSQDSKIIYVPSGQQLTNFYYFNLLTLAHKQIYNTFSIIIDSRALKQNEYMMCLLIQQIDGTQIGKYSNYQQFNLTAGLNKMDDFIFIMNPYQNYSFLQNDIICPNYTLRFDVRILPCQLGEYFFQNKCITCDISKNLYSIIKKAQYCQNFNPQFISEIRVGRVKLQKNYWRPSLTTNLIEKCETDYVCLGGWMNGDLSCKQSRVGAMCKECDIYNLNGEGQFALSGQECYECQPNILLLLQGFGIFLWILFITFMNYNTSKKIADKFLQFKLINKVYSDILMRQSIDQFSIIIKIYINYIFIMYLVQEYLQFLDNKILLTLNFISNPGIIITTELDCILVQIIDIDIQYLQLAYTLISPIIVRSVVYIIYVILIALKFQRYHFNIIIIITYSVYIFNYQIIIQSQTKLLSYKIISGIKWIYSNQQFQFYTSKHIQMITYFIAPTTSLILLIPIILFFLLRSKDRGSIQCIKKYGIMYCDFKQNAYFWEIIRIYTKHIIIFLLYFLNQVDQSILILFLMFIFFSHEYLKPYPLKNINKLENHAYKLTAFQLIVIFQLINQLPTLSYAILTILNIGFAYRILLLLIRCFRRQYRIVIQKIIQLLRQKFPNRFQQLEQQNIQIYTTLQKFRRVVHKKILNKQSILYNTKPIMTVEKENLFTKNAEIELQPLQHSGPLSEQIKIE